MTQIARMTVVKPLHIWALTSRRARAEADVQGKEGRGEKELTNPKSDQVP